jgi:hypothetical protein
MTESTRELLEKALKLPPKERAKLATELFDSLDEDDDATPGESPRSSL